MLLAGYHAFNRSIKETNEGKQFVVVGVSETREAVVEFMVR